MNKVNLIPSSTILRKQKMDTSDFVKFTNEEFMETLFHI